MSNRAIIRHGMDPGKHLEFLDQDIDDVLAAVESLRDHLNKRMDRQDKRIGAFLTTAVGCLVSLVGVLVLLAITLGTR